MDYTSDDEENIIVLRNSNKPDTQIWETHKWMHYIWRHFLFLVSARTIRILTREVFECIKIGIAWNHVFSSFFIAFNIQLKFGHFFLSCPAMIVPFHNGSQAAESFYGWAVGGIFEFYVALRIQMPTVIHPDFILVSMYKKN